jgi:hypothetical protein
MKPLDKYIELVYGKNSELRVIDNMIERKAIAAERAGLPDVPDSKSISKLITEFQVKQNHYKQALLVSKMEVYWEVLESLREPLKSSPDDDKRLKNLKLKEDMSDFCSKLVPEIEALVIDVYTEEFKEEGTKVVASFEQRLMDKKK